MNIKLQADSIHFIQNRDRSNKIFKYVENNEYGSIELIKTINDESDIKFCFMIDISNKYQDSYLYLFG